MLVLSRKVGESVVIDGGIVIRVLDVQVGRIRIGIEAPSEVAIRRSELAEIAQPTPSERHRTLQPGRSRTLASVGRPQE